MCNSIGSRVWTRYLLVLLAGACLPLAFAPFNLYPLAILAPAVLFYFWLDCNPWQGARLSYVFGLGFFGVGVSWVFIAIHEFGNTNFIVAVLLTAFAVSFLALVIGSQGYVSVYLIKRIKAPIPRFSPFVLLLIFPMVWTLFEWLRVWFLTGFPWLSLGYSQIDIPISGMAPIIGVYGVSWAIAVSAGAVILLMRGVNHIRVQVSLILLVLWGSAFLLGRIEWSDTIDEPIKVSLVQGNVPQITKWDPDMIWKGLERYANLTRKHWDSDLIVWPENAITVFYHEIAGTLLEPLAKEARDHKADLVVGLPIRNLETQQYYSSMMSIGRTPGVYHKHHLVPFGEFLPLESLLRGVIAFFNLPMSSFSPGKVDQPLLHAAGQPFAVSICYEDSFGEEFIRHLPEATLLINGSNNAWYGNSLAPHQHLQISRMRALETGRELMRVTTNGISAIVDHRGKVVANSPQFEPHVLKGTVQPRTGTTPYVFWGNSPILVGLWGILIATLIMGRQKTAVTTAVTTEVE